MSEIEIVNSERFVRVACTRFKISQKRKRMASGSRAAKNRVMLDPPKMRLRNRKIVR